MSIDSISIVDFITLFLSIIATVFSVVTYRNSIIHDRRQATLDAYNQLQEQALDHLNYYMPSEIVEIAKNPRSEEYKKVSSYVARVEHFCVGVNQKIYDSETVYALAKDYLDGVIRARIEPIIDRKNKFGSDNYYENIHRVYDWKEKHKK